MDPLTATLAVISLATAVKDMVELGQKIHESFAKVSRNYQKAQSVAKDIRDMVDEINVFCEDHQDTLDNMKELRLDLLGLLAKFRNFEASILPLLPQAGGRRRDRLTRAWEAWRSNNKAEERILDLHNDIVKVMRRYMWRSVMRTEVALEANHRETRKVVTDVHNDIAQGLQVLEVVRRDVSAIAAVAVPYYSYKSSGTISNEFDCSITMFAGSTTSTSAPMLRTPEVITEEVATTAFIKVQIDSIAMIVKTMSILPASAQNSVEKFSWTPSLLIKLQSMDIMHLRYHIVREVIGIRELLDTGRQQSISVGGILALNRLSVALGILNMPHDGILVGSWAVTLSRMLVNASSDKQPDLDAFLALYLLNQSIRSRGKGNNARSLQAIVEAYSITQNLQNQHGEHFQTLHSKVLLEYARLVDKQQSIRMCTEAIHILEDTFNVQALTHTKYGNTIESVAEPCSSFLDNLFSSTSPKTAIVVYADLLQRLGALLLVDGCPNNALGLHLLAIAVYRKLVSVYKHEQWETPLAQALSSLLRDATAMRMPAREILNTAEECIQLLRGLAGGNPPYYARQLVGTLWIKATTLQDLGQDAEAITTWEEIATLARQIVQDSELCSRALRYLSDHFRRLERYDDAARTGTLAITTYQENAEIQATRYFNLSKDLRQLRRYKESVEAARTSVALYRRLAMRDPEKSRCCLIVGLSDLAHCLVASGEYSEALVAWKESTTMLDNHVHTNSDTSCGVYLDALDSYTYISHILQDKEESLKVCSTAIQYLRQLSEIYPQDTHITEQLLWTEFSHAHNMVRFGCLEDAQHYIDESRPSSWTSESEIHSECVIAAWDAAKVTLKADVLDAQGFTEQALLVCRKVPGIVSLFVGTCQAPFDRMISSMVQEARLQVDLGANEEAMKVAEEALQLARNSKLEPVANNLVRSLYGVAFTALSHRNYKRVIEAAQEGCIISACQNWKNGDRQNTLTHFSLFALLSFAEANLGRYDTALEYAHRAVDISLEIRDIKLYISATTAELSYMETRGNLANILFATGDHAQARQICEERRAYFSKRVDTRMGEYRELAPILRMLGILCCSEGRHEEGEAAAQELSRIMMTLGIAFPSLQEQVKIRLRNQAEVPILKVLDNMSAKLDCGHQTEVGSSFSICVPRIATL
ncbi:hypothetical protein D9619_008387 [Psilocybe cf. subviscida]|uniref:Anaphase-promoting complex subunit 5 domain-containing protein n=1 Tax=Psilocybe cf. subviscida TaxID=2480587 RepID=A0A8H5BAG5_9AGAR|nr:hypothetical protein D9619_008387 [Psilocybe cf. subviscida]